MHLCNLFLHVPLIIIFLAADVFGWPKSQCMFPAWTTRSSWMEITGRHVYTTNDMGDVIDVGYRSSPASQVETSTSLRCFRILARNTTSSHVAVIAFSVRGCSARYQCISFVKRKDSVIELHKGWSTTAVFVRSLFVHQRRRYIVSIGKGALRHGRRLSGSGLGQHWGLDETL